MTALERHGGGWGAPVEYRSSETVTCAEPRLSISVDRLYAILDGI